MVAGGGVDAILRKTRLDVGGGAGEAFSRTRRRRTRSRAEEHVTEIQTPFSGPDADGGAPGGFSAPENCESTRENNYTDPRAHRSVAPASLGDGDWANLFGIGGLGIRLALMSLRVHCSIAFE